MKNFPSLSLFIFLFINSLYAGEIINTVDYYKAHPSERKAKIAECKNNPGELKKTPNCQNAVVAHRTGGTKPDPRSATDAKQFDRF